MICCASENGCGRRAAAATGSYSCPVALLSVQFEAAPAARLHPALLVKLQVLRKGRARPRARQCPSVWLPKKSNYGQLTKASSEASAGVDSAPERMEEEKQAREIMVQVVRGMDSAGVGAA